MVEISIITATFNAENTLKKMIESIISQNQIRYELIIIDGKSTDNTIKTIKKYDQYISYWSSEPDEGIYDAWNKGIARANADWIMFLGADDTLTPNALENYKHFLKNLKQSEDLHFVSSRKRMIDLKGKMTRIEGHSWQWPKFSRTMTVSHPGALHSKKLFFQYGIFDINYKICGDYELLLRPKSDLKTAFLDNITVNASEGGASDSIAAIVEYYKVLTTTGNRNKISVFTQAIFITFKFIIKKGLRKIGLNVYLQK